MVFLKEKNIFENIIESLTPEKRKEQIGSAIQNRNDVDITIKVRLDMDGPFGAPGTGSLQPATEHNIKLQKRRDGNFTWNPQGF